MDRLYPLGTFHVLREKVMARPTGERRKPQRGEWFLSNSRAIQAEHNMAFDCPIVELVEVEITATVIRAVTE